MAATDNAGLGHGTNGSPQQTIEEQNYPSKVSDNEISNNSIVPPKYNPSPKHQPGYGWGTENPIKTYEEGQKLLDSGYKYGKQVYNITDSGDIVKFQPDNSPDNGYHAYKVSLPRDIPPQILKKMRDDGKISKSDYNKCRKGQK